MKRGGEIVNREPSTLSSDVQPSKKRSYRFILPGPEPEPVPLPLNEPSDPIRTFLAMSKGGEPQPIHEQLDDPSRQVRLLAAVPASQSDELAFRISNFWLADAPDFHAISYTWGDESNQRIVSINEQQLRVNHNCFYALWQASLYYSNIFIWIDSICIDQSNTAEKSAQVRIMAEIYSRAARVLACVGSHADNSAWLIIMAGYLVRLVQFTGIENKELYGKRAVLWGLLKQVFSDEARELLFIAYWRFQHRKYWKRLWIQQEIASAHSLDVLCDDSKLPWETLVLMKIGDFWSDYRGERWISLGQWGPQPLTLASVEKTDLEQLLLGASRLECKDLRDRVYGLQGFLEPWYRDRILPDYTLTRNDLARQIAAIMPFHKIHSVTTCLKPAY